MTVLHCLTSNIGGGQKVIQRWFCFHLGHMVWLFVTSTSFTHTFPSFFNFFGFFDVVAVLFFETGSHWVDLVGLKLEEIRHYAQLYIYAYIYSLSLFPLFFFPFSTNLGSCDTWLPVCLKAWSVFEYSLSSTTCLVWIIVLRIQLQAPCMVDKSLYCWATPPASAVRLHNDYIELLYMNSF